MTSKRPFTEKAAAARASVKAGKEARSKARADRYAVTVILHC